MDPSLFGARNARMRPSRSFERPFAHGSSASAISSALEKRSATDRASALWTAAASASGTSGRSDRIGGSESQREDLEEDFGNSPLSDVNGVRPVSISYTMTPTE